MLTIIGAIAVISFITGGGIFAHRQYSGRWLWQAKNSTNQITRK